MPLATALPQAVTRRWQVISLRVRVPVLSEQITLVAPNVSTAGSWRTMAWRAAMRCTPMARVMVITAGNPSGMKPTASATTVISASSQCRPRASTAKANSSTDATRAMMASCRPKRLI